MTWKWSVVVSKVDQYLTKYPRNFKAIIIFFKAIVIFLEIIQNIANERLKSLGKVCYLFVSSNSEIKTSH